MPIDELMSQIFPPVFYEKDDKYFMKEITCKKPSRKDLDALEKRLLALMKN